MSLGTTIIGGGAEAPPLRHRLRTRRWRIVAALAVTETVSYGILYYAFAAFLVPMERDLGFSAAQLTGAFSLSLLVAAGVGVVVGRHLDRRAPRAVMTGGSAIGALLVLAWSQVESLAAFYAIWIAIGVVMAMVLYEVAFTVLAKAFPEPGERRGAMTAMTLVAALASFIFLPLSQSLIDAHGWRDALVVLVVILGATTVPLHAIALRVPEQTPAEAPPEVPAVPAGEALRSWSFWRLSSAFFLASLRGPAVDPCRDRGARRRARVPRRNPGDVDVTAERADIVIIGAGQAGLGSAYAAQRAGLTPVVLEATAEPTGSWPRYYESLKLFSPARYSALPGRPMSGDPERYPTRDELAAYLRDYAAWLGADIRTGQRVTQVRVMGARDFEIETATGLLLRAPYVIAATGGFGRPHRPGLPGEDGYEGSVVHTSEYRRPAGYTGKRVIVVGGGNSAVQVADELARVARVTLATRSPVKWQTQRPLGRDMHWWFDRSGLDAVPIGRLWLRLDGNPVVDDGAYRAALATGLYDRRPMFTRFTADGVQWADGRTEPVDAVILATGYRPSLDFLAATPALDEHGGPLHRAGVSTTVPGLGYVGLEFQRSFRSATVRGVGPDARRVLRRLKAQRDRPREASRHPASWLPRIRAALLR